MERWKKNRGVLCSLKRGSENEEGSRKKSIRLYRRIMDGGGPVSEEKSKFAYSEKEGSTRLSTRGLWRAGVFCPPTKCPAPKRKAWWTVYRDLILGSTRGETGTDELLWGGGGSNGKWRPKWKIFPARYG